MKTCAECGGKVRSKSYTHREQVGRFVVEDSSGMVPRCAKCDAPQLTGEALQRYELRAANVVLTERISEANGEVLRYARKALELRQSDLARLLGARGETVSRWEASDEALDRVTLLAMRGFVRGELDEPGATQKALEELDRTPGRSTVLTVATAA